METRLAQWRKGDGFASIRADWLKRAAGVGEQPVGRVRINSSASYANHVLAPVLPEFLALHPKVTLDIVRRRGNVLDERTVRAELEGNICRCTGYHNIVKAIQSGAAAMASARD